jgi:hypothetical protein
LLIDELVPKGTSQDEKQEESKDDSVEKYAAPSLFQDSDYNDSPEELSDKEEDSKSTAHPHLQCANKVTYHESPTLNEQKTEE